MLYHWKKKKFKKNCNQNTNKCQKSYSHHIKNPFPNPFVLLFNKKKEEGKLGYKRCISVEFNLHNCLRGLALNSLMKD